MLDLIKLVGEGGPQEDYAVGAWIFVEGQPGDVMYVVKSGRVDVVYDEHVLETVTPGGVLGEMALLGRTIRSANAVARTDCTLVSIDAQRFLDLIRAHPEFALAVMKAMANRLSQRTAEGG